MKYAEDYRRELMDWKAKAKELRFTDGLSLTQTAKELEAEFPDKTPIQVYEKVKRFLRNTKEYSDKRFIYTGNEQFHYTFDNPINIYPFGDWHLGSAKTDEKKIIAYIDRILADPNGYVILVGDLCENATQNSKGDVFGQCLAPREQKERVMQLLYPLRDRILFMCHSNHEERTYRVTGQDIMYDIAVGIDCLDKYNFTHGFIHLKVCGKKVNIYATHNLGKAETKLKSKGRVFADIDILIGGHIHEPKVVNVIQKFSNGKTREIRVVTCRGWNVDEHYAISGAYDPVSHVNPEIFIDKDIRVSH